LVFATNMVKLELSLEKRQRLMQAYLELKSYPDALPALKSVRDAGIVLAFPSNLTPSMLNSAIKSSGLEGIFEPSLSTDSVRVYKPHPRAYQMGIDAFNLRREEIVFAAFGGWDAAGAASSSSGLQMIGSSGSGLRWRNGTRLGLVISRAAKAWRTRIWTVPKRSPILYKPFSQ
jgi:2-haloalkanoic acid dehalogenase type II